MSHNGSAQSVATALNTDQQSLSNRGLNRQNLMLERTPRADRRGRGSSELLRLRRIE